MYALGLTLQDFQRFSTTAPGYLKGGITTFATISFDSENRLKLEGFLFIRDTLTIILITLLKLKGVL